MPWERLCVVWLDWYLRGQAGVLSHGQALSAGLSPAAIRRRVATGHWERLHPRVYLSADRELCDQARLWAAVLWAGPDAVAHGVAAAWWHGLVPTLPCTVDVTVPRARQPRSRPGIRVRRRNLASVDQVELRRLPVTEVPLTVLEAMVALGTAGPALLDRALQRRVRFGTLRRAHFRNLGRVGSPQAGWLLAAAADRAASAAERELVRLLRRAGIAGWVLAHAVGSYVVDIAFPGQRLAVEVDGWAWHVDGDRFREDRRRQNALVLAGWTVLRFTWHDLTQRPDHVVAEIRAFLERAAELGS